MFEKLKSKFGLSEFVIFYSHMAAFFFLCVVEIVESYRH